VAETKHGNNPATWLFASAYAACCFLFWWLTSLLLRYVLNVEDVVEHRFLWYGVAALLLFLLGYVLPSPKFKRLRTNALRLDRCQDLSWFATIVIAAPALLLAGQFAFYRSGVNYGEGESIPFLYQVVLYAHLFFGLLFLGAADDAPENRWRIWVVALLTIAPRVLVSLHWGRFFSAQAIVPIIFIAIARGWVRVTAKRLFQFAVLALMVVFVPPLTRGDKLRGEDDSGKPALVSFLQAGTVLVYLQDYLDLPSPCPPLLVSLTAKVVPYSALGVCVTDVGDERNLPATLDLVITRELTNDRMRGAGGNYILELYLTGGVVAVVAGSVIFGFTCRRFIELIGHRSLYAGIWAECLSRALFAPRGTLGYVYERIPSLVLATLAVVAVSWAIAVLKRRTGISMA